MEENQSGVIIGIADLEQIYLRTFALIKNSRKITAIKISYYPYVNLNHTIRIRSGVAHIRISDLFTDAPIEIHEALAIILVTKLISRRVPKEARGIYNRYLNSDRIRIRSDDRKRDFGRKIVTTAKGIYFDLDELFDELNQEYFHGEMSKPVITWSKKKSYRRLGHFDSTHKTISISRLLDSKFVPPFVVAFVVYHEMLHIAYPTQHRNGRRYSHTAAFRNDEQLFAYHEDAELWITNNAEMLKKLASKN